MKLNLVQVTMQETSDDHLVQAWNVLDRLIDENEFLKEENQKLIQKIEHLKRKQSSGSDYQQNSNR
jgi:hypothetical protein